MRSDGDAMRRQLRRGSSFKLMSTARAECVRAPIATKSTPVSAIALTSPRDPAGRLERHATGDQAHRLAQDVRRHVVEQDEVGLCAATARSTSAIVRASTSSGSRDGARAPRVRRRRSRRRRAPDGCP
jgi:hypothetical protein